MKKEQAEALLNVQVERLIAFTDGYKACVKFVLENFPKEETKEDDGTGIPDSAPSIGGTE